MSSYIENPKKFPTAPCVESTPSPRSGYLAGIHARIVGETAVMLGAGRSEKDDPIDHRVGIHCPSQGRGALWSKGLLYLRFMQAAQMVVQEPGMFCCLHIPGATDPSIHCLCFMGWSNNRIGANPE